NTPSSDWGDYTWFPVDPEDPNVGFGSDNLYIKILGNRNCEFKIAASNSDPMFVTVTGAPIDLDELIPDNSIDTDKIKDGAITTPKIADGAVTHAKLDDDAVDTNNIREDAVTGFELADNSVNTNHLVDGAVTIP